MRKTGLGPQRGSERDTRAGERKGQARARVDQFLVSVGLFKRRAAAKRACLQGEVWLEGRSAKPGERVAAKQRLRIRLKREVVEGTVLGVPSAPVPKSDRSRYFAVRAVIPIDDE